jgi:hypothetical protein
MGRGAEDYSMRVAASIINAYAAIRVTVVTLNGRLTLERPGGLLRPASSAR